MRSGDGSVGARGYGDGSVCRNILHNRSGSDGCIDTSRRVIFPWMHARAQPASIASSQHHAIITASDHDRDAPITTSTPEKQFQPLARSNSLPYSPNDTTDVNQIDVSSMLLPLPSLTRIPKKKVTAQQTIPTTASTECPSAASIPRRMIGLEVRDSVFDRPAIESDSTLKSPPTTARAQVHLQYTPISTNSAKWVAKFPTQEIRSPPFAEKDSATSSAKSIFGNVLHHKTYYPAATAPIYHQPPREDSKLNATTVAKRPPSILRTRSNLSSGHRAVKRDKVRKSSSVPINPHPLEKTSQEEVKSTMSFSPDLPTLASPTSIRSLNREDGETSGNSDGVHYDIGETEQGLQKISDSPKVILRKDNVLRRNVSDTVVAKSEEEQRQRRRRSTHAKSASIDIGDFMEAEDKVTGEMKDSFVSHEGSVSRHESLEYLPSNKKISFDPHIWVYEYKATEFERRGGDKWFTEDELTQFKEEAIQRIRHRSMKMIPTGTGRVVEVPGRNGSDRKQTSSPVPVPPSLRNNGNGKSSSSVVFTHPALSCEDEFDPDTSCSSRTTREEAIQDALSREMRNVLLVDPHEIFLSLFTKSLKYMIPHVSVATARSGEEAMARIQAAQKAFPRSDGGAVHGFDIIIVEERLLPCFAQRLSNDTCESDPGTASGTDLIPTQSAGDDSIQRQRKLTSGSALISSLVKEEREIRQREASNTSIRFSLLIGVSARLAEDRPNIERSGADFVWGKPPPEMNSSLKTEMLKILMCKRNKAIGTLFD
eukprot:scaffold825_cov196-Alexandrium_tamarense.AAC.12